jgi:hypothetical protein
MGADAAPRWDTAAFQGFFPPCQPEGRRFMNEDTWMQAKSVRCLMQTGATTPFSVFDSKYLDEIGERWDRIGGQGMAPLSVVGDKYNREMMAQEIVARPGRRQRVQGGYAGGAGVPHGGAAEVFKKTVVRYNALVAAGDDTDFGKRSELLTTG